MSAMFWPLKSILKCTNKNNNELLHNWHYYSGCLHWDVHAIQPLIAVGTFNPSIALHSHYYQHAKQALNKWQLPLLYFSYKLTSIHPKYLFDPFKWFDTLSWVQTKEHAEIKGSCTCNWNLSRWTLLPTRQQLDWENGRRLFWHCNWRPLEVWFR